jgi:hypothetical protein
VLDCSQRRNWRKRLRSHGTASIDTLAIFALNLFGGWRALGWIAAIVLACINDTKRAQHGGGA